MGTEIRIKDLDEKTVKALDAQAKLLNLKRNAYVKLLLWKIGQVGNPFSFRFSERIAESDRK